MFDFIENPPLEPKQTTLKPPRDYHGPNTKDLKNRTRRHVVQDIIDVYFENDGKELMRRHMAADPKAFFNLISKMIPANPQMEEMAGLVVQMIDRFANPLGEDPLGEDPLDEDLSKNPNLLNNPPHEDEIEVDGVKLVINP